ncbi:MAG: sugar ABC transporter ATP-binding protein [Chloroflexota bacterium]
MSDYVLEMKGICKDFYGTAVLRNVDLSVRAGEIHALIGENGAGKSTLMNILFGMPVIAATGGFQGEVRIDGVAVSVSTPRQAMELGVGMVHQEFMLLPAFTITENIKLNRELLRPTAISRALGPRLASLDNAAMRRDARAALDRLSLGVDEWLPVAGLPVGHMQFIEIAREIDKRNMKLLVFDEPTAVLTEGEAEDLLAALRRLAGEGVGVLFITHRLSEVLEVADRITVLRDGEVVGRLQRDEARIERLAELMVGRPVTRAARGERRTDTAGGIAVAMRNLTVEMPGERLRGLDFEVRRGEILGIGGLAGHGKVAIANGIMGLYPASGDVAVNGRPLALGDPRQAMAAGLGFLSEDRRGVGLLLDESVEFNIIVTSLIAQGRFLRRGLAHGWLATRDAKAARAHALQLIRDLDIRCTGPDQPVRRLSGGNQQKVCLARALTQNPDILFVSEPTRGIDVGAKQIVLDLLTSMNRTRGTTIIMTSSELAELRQVCDRVLIVYGGRVAGCLAPDASDVDFGLLMAGGGAEVRSA